MSYSLNYKCINVTDVNFGDVFLKERDQELKNLLKYKKVTLGQKEV